MSFCCGDIWSFLVAAVHILLLLFALYFPAGLCMKLCDRTRFSCRAVTSYHTPLHSEVFHSEVLLAFRSNDFHMTFLDRFVWPVSLVGCLSVVRSLGIIAKAAFISWSGIDLTFYMLLPLMPGSKMLRVERVSQAPRRHVQ